LVRAQEEEQTKPLQFSNGFFVFNLENMSHCCYILHSEKLNRFYVGYSADLDERLKFHENPESRKFTNNAKDWELYLIIDCQSKSQGLSIEGHIKKMKSKTYIQNLKKYPEMVSKLLENYQSI
jgi:putative endonuclease